MRRKLGPVAALALLLAAGAAPGPTLDTIRFDSEGGDAWTFEKRITGTVSPERCEAVRLRTGTHAVEVEPAGGRFDAVLMLGPGGNDVRAECLHEGATLGPPARQEWTVRLRDAPETHINVAVEGSLLQFDGAGTRPGRSDPAPVVDYQWRARTGNPAELAGLPAHGKRVSLRVPPANGEYFVTLRVVDSRGRADESTVMFRVRDGAAAAAMPGGRAAWIDHAVVYGAVPSLFGPRGFKDVTAALPRLAALGVNTLWLSPITAAAPDDFGYAVTDQFRLNSKWGSEADLRALIAAAHARRIRVIFDLVANHLSDRSAYFQSAVRLKDRSPYFKFFDRDAGGAATHYFDWRNLENLNYGNPEVQAMIIAASERWVRDFDVDGFRVDAAWGPRQRKPEFWPAWSAALKRIKPDVLLLAEAAADDPYYHASGFAAAYDWTEQLGEWAWRRPFDEEAATIDSLRTLIARPPAGGSLRFRFINNNDTGPRFVTRYGVGSTRVAAAMLLTLPGLPALFAGDEVGAAYEPYRQEGAIDWQDRLGWQSWYQRLLRLREDHPSLRSSELQIVDVGPKDHVLAYMRHAPGGRDPMLVLLNYGAEPAEVEVPAALRQELGPGPLVDVLGGEVVGPDVAFLAGYGVRIIRRSGAVSPPA